MRNIKRKNKLNKDRLRMAVYRTNTNIYVQIIDDIEGKTIASASSLKIPNGGNLQGAIAVGKEIAIVAKEREIQTVVFDRSIYPYKGRIKALADSARENGLKF